MCMKNCTILLHFIVISLEADTITNMEGVEYVCLPDHCRQIVTGAQVNAL
jgi:hypothetical protein